MIFKGGKNAFSQLRQKMRLNDLGRRPLQVAESPSVKLIYFPRPAVRTGSAPTPQA